VLLIFLSLKTTLKGIKLFREESKAKRRYLVQAISEVSEREEGSDSTPKEMKQITSPKKEVVGFDESLKSNSEFYIQIVRENSKDNTPDNSQLALPKPSYATKKANPANDPLLGKSVSYFENAESVLIKSIDGSKTRILK